MKQSDRERLHILNVGTLPPHWGGSALSNAELVTGLRRLGHQMVVISPIKPEQYVQEIAGPSCDLDGVQVERIVLEYLSPSVPPPEAYRRLKGQKVEEAFATAVERSRPDIVMMGRESFAWYVPDLCARWGLPSLLIACGTPTSGFLEGIYPESLQSQLIHQYSKVDLIVTVSRHLERIIRSFDLGNVSTIPNGVNLTLFRPEPKDPKLLEELAIGPDHVVIGHISQLNARKRPLDIVHSAKLTLEENAMLIYLIIGDGPSRKEMQDACRDSGVTANFRFIGRVDYRALSQYINLSDAVVMPSEQEGLARVYLETQACAKLLIASDIPPAREVIRDGTTGLLFHKGRIDDLAAKTLLAARNPDLRQRLGENARKAVEQYDLDDMVRAYSEALIRTVGSFASKRGT